MIEVVVKILQIGKGKLMQQAKQWIGNVFECGNVLSRQRYLPATF